VLKVLYSLSWGSYPLAASHRMEIALALVSALLFALGSVLAQRAALGEARAGPSSSLLLRMARRPLWLAGTAADALGFVAQAGALGAGRLAVVQPLLVTAVVFALPLGVWLTEQRLHRNEVVAAALVVIALGGFLLIATPSGGRGDAPVSAWLIAILACAVACAPLAALGRAGPARRRAALLGTSTGILFALSAALTKAVVDRLGGGVLHVVAGWELYALILVGYVSMTLNQLALATGALAAAVATSTALDPIVSVILGLTVFDEALHASGPRAAGTVGCLVAALGGMVVLARQQSDSVAA